MGSNLGNLEKLVLTTESFLQSIKTEICTSQSEGCYLRIANTRDCSKYPLTNRPEKVFLFNKNKGVVIDSDTYINPYTTKCDAYVLTDKGIHLIYIKGSANFHNYKEQEPLLSDPLYKKLNEGYSAYPMFFLSKITNMKRVCIPVSRHGNLFSAEYNFLVDQYLELPF